MKRVVYIILIMGGISLLGACSASVRFSSVQAGSKAAKSSGGTASAKETFRNNANTKPIDKINSPRLHQEQNNNLIAEINRWLGTPYCYGGYSFDCTDCSGFVLQVFKSLGYTLPRTAFMQYDYTERISEPRLGDLVFFSNNGQDISHVGVCIGNGEFAHASTSSGVVRQMLNDSYYKEHFAGYGRIKSFVSEK